MTITLSLRFLYIFGVSGLLCGAAVSAAVVDNWFLPCLDELLSCLQSKILCRTLGAVIIDEISFSYFLTPFNHMLKFIYSEKATKFGEISTNYLSNGQIIGGYLAKFCGLLRIYEP